MSRLKIRKIKKVKSKRLYRPETWRAMEMDSMKEAIWNAERQTKEAHNTIDRAIAFFDRDDRWDELRELAAMKLHACRAWVEVARKWVDEWERAERIATAEIEKRKKVDEGISPNVRPERETVPSSV